MIPPAMSCNLQVGPKKPQAHTRRPALLLERDIVSQASSKNIQGYLGSTLHEKKKYLLRCGFT